MRKCLIISDTWFRKSQEVGECDLNLCYTIKNYLEWFSPNAKELETLQDLAIHESSAARGYRRSYRQAQD